MPPGPRRLPRQPARPRLLRQPPAPILRLQCQVHALRQLAVHRALVAGRVALALPPAHALNDLLEPQPRFHFDYFVPSMLTVFNLMTGSFYSPMTEHMQAAGWGVSSGYFIAAVLVGNYLVMNLFVAILLNAFADDSDDTASMASSSRLG